MKTIEERIAELQARLHEGRVNGSTEFDLIGDQARINELSMLLDDNDSLRTIQVGIDEEFDIDECIDTVNDALCMASKVKPEYADLVMHVLYKLKKTIRG